MKPAFDFNRDRWTPYAMVEQPTSWRVTFLAEDEVFPARAALFLVPASQDQSNHRIMAQISALAFKLPAANKRAI